MGCDEKPEPNCRVKNARKSTFILYPKNVRRAGYRLIPIRTPVER
jgi:hypothetical protein